MKEFENAKWIWTKTPAKRNCYGEFKVNFSVKAKNNVKLRLSCDGIYAAYVNGTVVGFSQCADFPHYKLYDEIDITSFCKGENDLRIVVWHTGLDTQTYIKAAAGVLFEVEVDGLTVSSSGEKILSRSEFGYKNGLEKIMTLQLGDSFLFDNTVIPAEFEESVLVEKTKDLHKRPVSLIRLEERRPVKIQKTEDGYLIDMGRETAGYLELDIESAEDQSVLIAYGEHIVDGKVRYIIEERNFSVEFIAKKGKNVFANHLRRLAGRYLEVHCEKELKINYLGIRPAYYPVKLIEKNFTDELDKKIYDVAAETLLLCMHEHYEDCPWREQALYTMDSRNQMLCGYYLYENTEFQRHNLVLISKSIREDGFLCICAPSGLDLPIPSFSCAYFIEVYEYLKYTKDYTLLDEVAPVLHKIIAAFEKFTDENMLIPRLPHSFWNFYEWNECGNGGIFPPDKYEKIYDSNLNLMYIIAKKLYCEMFGVAADDINGRIQAVKDTFYVEDKGVFKLSTDGDRYSQLCNALAVSAGLGNEALAEKILHDENMITATLSMRIFVYDALLTFGDKYRQTILDDVRARYKKMLDAGATSFWETELGEADFNGAGSLCHGWSAIPVYYFNILSVK